MPEVYEADQELAKLATQTFDLERFVHVPGVCVFAEHETMDSKGRPQKYDKTALAAIVEKCNSRIRETGDYAILSDGHTPEKDEMLAGAKNPDVLGFLGNFRLGRIGNQKQRYAIFADEWHFKDVHDRVARLPRRSVEVWMHPKMGERFFDPVAALGSETPRLDLGVKFARLRSGELVEKYSAATAAYPASGNVFVPTLGDKKKRKDEYQAPSQGIAPAKAKKILKDGEVHGKSLSTKQQGMFGAAAGRAENYEADQTGGNNMLADEELKQILDAFNEMDVVKWVRSQMAEQTAGPEGDEYQADEEDETNGGLTGDAPPVEAEGDGGPEAGVNIEEDEEKEEEAGVYSKDKGGEEVVKMSRAERTAEREKYRKLNGAYAALKKEHYALKENHDKVLREASDTAREAKLDELALRFAIDADEEKDRCLYGRGSDMTTKSFAAHVGTIERLASPSPVGHGVPAGEIRTTENSDAEVAKYQRAIEYAEEKRANGETIDWEGALRAVEHANGSK